MAPQGQEVLVRAAALLRERHPNAHYVFLGKPSPGNEDHETRLRDLIAGYGLEDVVMLAGEIEDTASVFAALDIAVAPPVQAEPFGCVVLEAMAVGTSVVGSRAGGIAEQIVHGETGRGEAPHRTNRGKAIASDLPRGGMEDKRRVGHRTRLA